MQTLVQTSLIKTLTLIGVCSWLSTANAMVQFEDVSSQAGFGLVTQSYGACWGDIDGDGWLDLYAGNHPLEHSLYHNLQDGTFEEVHAARMPFVKRDAHGCFWADFDRDGDQDMLLLSGGNGGGTVLDNNKNQFYINDGAGFFTEQAELYNIDNPTMRARTPLWFDYDKDGFLDVVLTHVIWPSGGGESKVMRQTDSGFEDVSDTVDFEIPNTVRWAQLTDVTGDGALELLAWQGPGDVLIFDLQTIPFQEISSTLSNASFGASQDVAIGDFNGDLRSDIYVAWQTKGGDELAQLDAHELRMAFTTEDGNASSVRFKTDGNADIDVELSTPFLHSQDVYIGSTSEHPVGSNEFSFSLTPSIGMPDFEEGVDEGIFLGFDNTTNEWVFTISLLEAPQAARPNLYAIVSSSAEITAYEPIGFTPNGDVLSDRMKLQTDDGFSDATWSWLPSPDHPSVGVVEGDFDNDGDLDLYVVNSLGIINQPNTLYENKGDRFEAIENAGGAEGSTLGVGNSVVTADYDRDGFLDLYVTNGGRNELFGTAQHQLFHNLGNDNHWLQIDLIGVESNPHGIGARVVLETDGVAQLREQNGGVHAYHSNGNRLHFGVGANTVIDRLTITWPSGRVQELTDIAIDQVLQVIEPSEASGDGGTLGGVVWEDINGDGIRDHSEPLYQGLEVELYDCYDESTVLANTASDAEGLYRFKDLSGMYKVRFLLPADYAFSPLKQGAERGQDSDAEPNTGFTSCRDFAAEELRLGLGAGIVPGEDPPPGGGILGGFVWADLDGDGIRENPEPPYEGMQVELYECSDESTVLASTASDATGLYLFQGLRGSYKVRFILPDEHTFSPFKQGDERGQDSDADPETGFTSCRDFVAEESRLGLGSGVIPKEEAPPEGDATLGGIVWEDLDEDGIREDDEPLFEGISVELYYCQDNQVLATTQSNSYGIYSFNHLPDGAYQIGFVVPDGYTLSPFEAGELRGFDSDADPETGLTSCRVLSGTQSLLGLGAGLYLD